QSDTARRRAAGESAEDADIAVPEIVAAAAKPFEHVGQFTVLNGAQGVTSALAEIIQQAGTLTSMARESLLPALKAESLTNGNGEVKSQ
ncbi:hypothetical protein, partial [Nocardia sp. NPDC004722]